MRTNKTRATIGPVLGLLFCAVACASCSSAVRQGTGSSYLIVDRLQAAAGSSTTSAMFGDILQSDVRTGGSVFEDPGQVTLRLAMKDVTALATGPTTNNDITVTRYHVRYTRSDGRSTQGVDVPYEFDGAVTGTVTADQAATLTFVIVRAQAKKEAPLAGLVDDGGSAKIISTIAEVTFYGNDQTGHAVAVTSKISINFADWEDPKQ
ncbi:MAG: hypothetical protein ACM3NQ_17660 [Bacteroidales bacterium]